MLAARRRRLRRQPLSGTRPSAVELFAAVAAATFLPIGYNWSGRSASASRSCSALPLPRSAAPSVPVPDPTSPACRAPAALVSTHARHGTSPLPDDGGGRAALAASLPFRLLGYWCSWRRPARVSTRSCFSSVPAQRLRLALAVGVAALAVMARLRHLGHRDHRPSCPQYSIGRGIRATAALVPALARSRPPRRPNWAAAAVGWTKRAALAFNPPLKNGRAALPCGGDLRLRAVAVRQR